MAETKKYIYEIEPAKPEQGEIPSIGPAYRSIFAKDGFPQTPAGMETCWDIFRLFSLLHFFFRLTFFIILIEVRQFRLSFLY